MGSSKLIKVFNIRGHQGQMVIESLLIMTICLVILIMASKMFKGADIVNHIISRPWARVAIMIETGSWSKSMATGRDNHPNRGVRSRILDTSKK